MGLLPEGRGKFDDAAVEGGEEAVFGGGIGIGFAAGEGAEGGKDELVFPKVEDGGAEAGVGAVFDAGHGVEVASDVKAFGVGEFFVGVVEDVKAVKGVFFDERELLAEGIFAAGGVVIAFDEGDGNGGLGEPGKEDIEDFGGASDAGVEEVAGDEEAGGLGFCDERVDAGEVGLGVAFGDGKAAGTEGG